MGTKGKAAVLDYHEASRIGTGGEEASTLRWSSLPPPPLLEQEGTEDAVGLPRTGLAPARGTFAAIAGAAEGAAPPPRSGGVLGAILAYGYGLVGAHRFPSGALPRRPAPSAGGLYPCTLVVATVGAGEVPAGVYAYAPVEHALVPVRPGSAAALAVRDAAGASGLGIDPVLLLVASYWRSAWKYKTRALRFCAQDAGHVVGALLAAAGGVDAGAEVLTLGSPKDLDELLGLEPKEAGVMAALGLRLLGPEVAGERGKPAALVRPAARGEPLEGSLLHAAVAAAGAPGRSHDTVRPSVPDGPATALPEPRGLGDGPPLADCVIRRHSVRRFRRKGIGLDKLALLIETASCGTGRALACGVAVRSVEGLDSGIYRYDPEGRRLVSLRAGRVTEELGAAALGQAYVGQAAACIMPLADMAATVAASGPRGYLDAYVDAGVGGQRLYLAATALGIGCCAVGSFHDAEVNMLACLDGSHESVLCLFPVGVPR